MLCGLTLTIRLIPSRRPINPSPFTLTSYHVGNPCMLEGKMFFAETGIPILKIDFANMVLALAEPVPLTFANLTTKSFTPPLDDIHAKLWSCYKRIFAYPMLKSGNVQHINHNEGRHLRL